MKEALYLVHADVDAALVDEYDAFYGKEHVPRVVAAARFSGAQRYRVVDAQGQPVDPPKFTTVYRASGLGVVRAYLEGGEVGAMRAHFDAWLAGRRATLSREILEENYAVDGAGAPGERTADAPVARAAFVVRARVAADGVGAWSTWYDREHMPAVAQHGFLRATRYRVVDESAGPARFAIVYEAPSVDAVKAFRAGPGPGFGKEHEEKFGAKVSVERVVWALVG